ncbi:UNVERIFIED_CONTAM: hypothetical protein FKN15_040212 [Acipenser sinensis]
MDLRLPAESHTDGTNKDMPCIKYTRMKNIQDKEWESGTRLISLGRIPREGKLETGGTDGKCGTSQEFKEGGKTGVAT